MRKLARPQRAARAASVHGDVSREALRDAVRALLPVVVESAAEVQQRLCHTRCTDYRRAPSGRWHGVGVDCVWL